MSTPNNPNNPKDLIEKLMKIMIWFIVSYFVIVFIPQLLAKLL